MTLVVGQAAAGIRNSVVPGPPSLSAALDPPALKGRAPGAAAASPPLLVIYESDIVQPMSLILPKH